MEWVKFPNGKVWLVGEHGEISGTVTVQGVEDDGSLEKQLDAIAEAATGSVVGLTDFAYRFINGDLVSFSGTASDWLEWCNKEPEDRDPEEFKQLDADSPELVELLSAQYGVNDACVVHALDALSTEYENEVSLTVAESGREIRFPQYPEECSYVRVVMDDLEFGYWNSDELGQAPAEVLGAILRGAAGGLARQSAG